MAKSPQTDEYGNKKPHPVTKAARKVVHASEVPTRILRAAAKKIEKKLGDA